MLGWIFVLGREVRGEFQRFLLALGVGGESADEGTVRRGLPMGSVVGRRRRRMRC